MPLFPCHGTWIQLTEQREPGVVSCLLSSAVGSIMLMRPAAFTSNTDEPLCCVVLGYVSWTGKRNNSKHNVLALRRG